MNYLLCIITVFSVCYSLRSHSQTSLYDHACQQTNTLYLNEPATGYAAKVFEADPRNKNYQYHKVIICERVNKSLYVVVMDASKVMEPPREVVKMSDYLNPQDPETPRTGFVRIYVQSILKKERPQVFVMVVPGLDIEKSDTLYVFEENPYRYGGMPNLEAKLVRKI
jgi:hypothetical protein